MMADLFEDCSHHLGAGRLSLMILLDVHWLLHLIYSNWRCFNMILPVVRSDHHTWLSLEGGLGVPLQQPLQHVAEQRLESGPR